METKAGLPNNCSQCGSPIIGSWFARNIDDARAGKGICADCMTPTAVLTATEADDLTTLTGLGAASAKKLTEAGITTFTTLRTADVELLAEATGISPEKLADWIEQAS